jgi:hypothetical protein
MPDPVITVNPVDLAGALTVDCSACGTISETYPQGADAQVAARAYACTRARTHANEVHDGLVVAEGWQR